MDCCAPACRAPLRPCRRSARPTLPRDLQRPGDGLAKRLRHTSSKPSPSSFPGGLDSTLALLVAVAFDRVGLPRDGIVASPCRFGTPARTRCEREKLTGASDHLSHDPHHRRRGRRVSRHRPRREHARRDLQNSQPQRRDCDRSRRRDRGLVSARATCRSRRSVRPLQRHHVSMYHVNASTKRSSLPGGVGHGRRIQRRGVHDAARI